MFVCFIELRYAPFTACTISIKNGLTLFKLYIYIYKGDKLNVSFTFDLLLLDLIHVKRLPAAGLW